MDSITDGALDLLRKDGRLSFTELARQLGTTRSAIAVRIAPMLDSGELRIVAAVHPRLLGLVVMAHLSLRITGDAGQVAGSIAESTGAVFVSETVGPFGVVVEVHAQGLPELQNILRSINAIPGVAEVQFLIYQQVLSSFFLGVEPEGPPADFDRIDSAIIGLLQHDGRTTYGVLAEEVGLSVTAVRARIHRLIDSGVMRIGALGQRSDSTGNLMFGLGINLDGPGDDLIALIAARRGLEFMGRVIGRYDLLATVPFTSLQDFNGFIDTIRAFPSVRHVSTWLHARIRQERYQLAATRPSSSA